MLKTTTLLSILLVLCISVSPAQIKQYNKDYRSSSHGWDDWDDIWDWEFDSRPMIEINYGDVTFDHKNFKGSFSENGLVEFKIGYSSLDRSGYSLVALQENFLFISRVSPSLKSDIDRDYDYKVEMLRGGFGWRKGLGYNSGHLSIIPYNQTSIAWSKIDENPFPSTTPPINAHLSLTDIIEGTDIIERYEDSYRFSVANEAGLKIELGPMIAFNGGYEVNTIFPRVKTWEMLGSFALEYGALGLLDEFIEEIEFSTPEAAPIVSFVLRSALHYTFYHLRQEDMNWPIKSEASLTFESFKIGTTFTF